MRGSPRGNAWVILVDKPEGWTSYDVVRAAKRSFGGKIGHAGTLDPFATGLLILLTGQATRISSILMDLPKEYLATAKLGAVSTTGDPTGEVSVTGMSVGGADVIRALERFRGPIRQKVPMTSAVKVGGERLYEKARRGEVVETPEREVMVYDAVLVRFDEGEQTADLLFRTGKGTYIRRLVEDIGAEAGAGAYTLRLRRLSIGTFKVDRALPAASLEAAPSFETGRHSEAARFGRTVEPGLSRAVMPVAQALDFLPEYFASGREEKRAANGNELRGALPEGRFRVTGAEGLLAVYEKIGDVARPIAVFPEPQASTAAPQGEAASQGDTV
ncbi:MAG: tRNA pseudouridine(55) synthase TruB [Thermoleophilia bacterium]